MKCIKKQQIQQFVDNECNEKERYMIEQHIACCNTCSQKYIEMKKLGSSIRESVNTLNVSFIEIPPFVLPQKQNRKTVQYIVYSLSAACILFFMLFLIHKKTQVTNLEVIIVQSIPTDIDANKPASEQNFVMEVYDGKGNRTEYFFE